jgi:hypothetical protein
VIRECIVDLRMAWAAHPGGLVTELRVWGEEFTRQGTDPRPIIRRTTAAGSRSVLTTIARGDAGDLPTL